MTPINDLPIRKTDIANACGVTRQSVQQWRFVPADQVLSVARASEWRVTPHQIRPDVYPHPEDGLPEGLRGASSACEPVEV